MRTLGAAVSLAAILASCGGGGDTPTDVERKTECDDRGINPERGRTGTCVQGGYKFTVVDRRDLLELENLAVKLNDYATARSVGHGSAGVARATGTFVIFDLTVTNKLRRPATFDDNQDHTLLLLGDNAFRESFEAADGPVADSCLVKRPAEIQPEASKTCKIIYDVPSPTAANLTSPRAAGNLNFFSGAVGDGLQRIGTIRLYR